MKLNSPFEISSRLLPALRVADATISIDFAKRDGREGRTRYQWYIDTPDFEATGNDLQSGCQGGSLQEGMASLLSFLSACGEALNYSDRTGHESDNADLFPRNVAEWAQSHYEELSMLAIELEENKELITD